MCRTQRNAARMRPLAVMVLLLVSAAVISAEPVMGSAPHQPGLRTLLSAKNCASFTGAEYRECLALQDAAIQRCDSHLEPFP